MQTSGGDKEKRGKRGHEVADQPVVRQLGHLMPGGFGMFRKPQARSHVGLRDQSGPEAPPAEGLIRLSGWQVINTLN